MATRAALWFLSATFAMLAGMGRASDSSFTVQQGNAWRADHRFIDLHQHIDCTAEHLARAVKIMDAVGLGVVVNLSGGTVTPGQKGGASEFERNKALADRLYAGRFVHYMNLDYTGWDAADFPERAAQQIEAGHRLGAAGFKEYKRLGLGLRDRGGKLIRVDDPKLDLMWKKCGELKLPVSIHVADPKAFWAPYDESNERWDELKDHRGWWFGDTNKFPAWKDLLEALDRVIGRHPETTFVCVHFGNNAEELEWVDAALDRRPNMMVDLAARIPELGRHNAQQVQRLFRKHQDRILFGTDFQVYDRLILGSSGSEPPPTDADAEVFFTKEWRWLETKDANWEHMTAIQGNWKISSIGLDPPVLRKIYFDNARKLLAHALPFPSVQARHISQDFDPAGGFENPLWGRATAAWIEQGTVDGKVFTPLSTAVRALWSDRYLYLRYDCPYTRLTVFEPVQTTGKRFGSVPNANLWDRDVVEAFIAADATDVSKYAEFEVAPTNEQLDLRILGKGNSDFDWKSGYDSAVRINKSGKTWTCLMRIPLMAWPQAKPAVGTQWRLNLFRCDRAHDVFLAWNPSLSGTFHVPERFGTLKFVE